MLLREKCNRRISREATFPDANLIDNIDDDQAEATRNTMQNVTIPPAVPSFSVKITKKKAKSATEQGTRRVDKRHRRIVGSSDVNMINYFVPFRPSSRIKSASRRREKKVHSGDKRPATHHFHHDGNEPCTSVGNAQRKKY